MSLINEALKKAQRQRVEDLPVAATPSEPGTVGAPVPRIPRRRPPLPTSTQVVLFGGAATLLVMAGVFVFIFFFSDSDPVPPTNPPVAVAVPPEVAPAAPAAPAAPPVVAVVEPPPAAVPAPTVSAQLPPAAPPSPAVTPPPIAPPPVAPTPVSEPAAPVAAPALVSAPAANPKVYEYLESLRVSGIRVSTTDPKVIINDRVYRLNDLVDRGTKLRLTGVESSTLTFEDDAGFEYRKSF